MRTSRPQSPLPPSERFTWYPHAGGKGGTGRFYDNQNKRFAARSEVQREVEKFQYGTAARMRELAEGLQTGRLTVAEWRTQMRDEIKASHRAAAAIARGGIKNMTPADWGFVGSKLREQYGYLDGFANDLISGKQKLNGTLKMRASMYGDAVWGTHSDMDRRQAAQSGKFTEERRVLGVAEHCSDCLTEAAKGWRKIGLAVSKGGLRRIGDSVCLTRCHCHFEFR